MTQVLQDLIAARDLLVKDGWIAGSLYSADGSHCAVGAIVDTVTPGGCHLFGGRGFTTEFDARKPRVVAALRELARHAPSPDPASREGHVEFMDDPSDNEHWKAIVQYNNGTFAETVLDLFNNTIAALTPAREPVPA